MATNTAVAELNRVQYVGLDFPTHFDDLRSELQTKFAADFNDFALSSLAIMLVDLTAYGLDTLSFYLDRRASDAYLETAQTRKAVARLTRQLGYKMGGAVSSSTDLAVRITTPVAFEVTIPKGFKFKGPSNLIFEVSEAVTYAPRSALTLSIPVYEGETITESFVGDGNASQVFPLRGVPTGKNVVQGSMKVLVDGTSYTEAEFLPITGGQYFEVGYNDDPATVRFGDGTVSQNDIPAPNATVSVSYIASSGIKGQVSANTISSVQSPLVVNFVTIPLTLTNPEAAVGGDDPESLERAKSLAPQVYKSRQVAITQSDYVALATAFADPLFGRVAVAQAISARSGSADLELQTLLQDVRNEVAPVKTAVDAQVVLLQAAATSATTSLSSATSSVSSITSDKTVATTNLNTATDTYLKPASSTTTLMTSQCNDGISKVAAIPTVQGVSLQTTVAYTQPTVGNTVEVSVAAIAGLIIGQTVQVSTSGIVTGGTYTVTTVPTTTSVLLTLVTEGTISASGTVNTGSEVSAIELQDALTQATNALLSQLFTDLSTNVTSTKTNITSSIASIGTASDKLTSIGTSASTATSSISAAQTSVTTMGTTIANAITLAVAPLATEGEVYGTVSYTLDEISAHVGELLSANCSANLVSVPILTKDADGFYAAPSLGLKNSLQTYLNARKSVTQTVSVASGEGALIKARLSMTVGVSLGFSENVVGAAVASAVDGLLKGRKFGLSLYISDIMTTVLAVQGVSYVSPSITGYLDPTNPSVTLTDKLDSYGNLIIDQSEVVSKATVTITTVVRTT